MASGWQHHDLGLDACAGGRLRELLEVVRRAEPVLGRGGQKMLTAALLWATMYVGLVRSRVTGFGITLLSPVSGSGFSAAPAPKTLG